MFLAKLRSLYWVKAIKEGCTVIESQWWWNPRLGLPCSKGVGPRLGIVWHAPPCGVIKFNVNGVACGKSGPVGCGGVLRDHSDIAVLSFIHFAAVFPVQTFVRLVAVSRLSLFS
ncbi:hypothetical protein Gohar_008570 [Gossypium harknessii]|uniref:Uncharacterized protein n=1 Tax=Gossypium harknessii TaxID=34285 RepID=A0A7J9GK34_9ROSI|nr:hypothetical protein [Gossypium harknessii]